MPPVTAEFADNAGADLLTGSNGSEACKFAIDGEACGFEVLVPVTIAERLSHTDDNCRLYDNLAVGIVDLEGVKATFSDEAVAVGNSEALAIAEIGEVLAPVSVDRAELEALAGLDVADCPELARLAVERVHCNSVTTSGKVPSLDACADHVHLVRKSGFLGEGDGGLVRRTDFTSCELEGEGDIVKTALFDLDVLSTCSKGIFCLAFVDIAEVGVCAHFACIVEGDLPCTAVSELEFTSLRHLSILDGVGDAVVAGAGSGHLSEAPSVHGTADTPLDRSHDDLGVGEVTCSIEVENDVIEAGLGNLHCGSGVTGLEGALEDSHLRVLTIDGAALFGSEGSKSCAVAGLLASLVKLKIEVLATLQDDVLLVHAGALGLVCSLVGTCSHHVSGLEFGYTGSIAGHIETVLDSLVKISLVVFFSARCEADSHECSCTQKKKLFHKTF